jgi:hypothetical protein
MKKLQMGFDDKSCGMKKLLQWVLFDDTLFVGIKKLATERSPGSSSVNNKLWVLFFLCRRVGALELV